MRSASARKSSPQTVTAVWRQKSAATEGFCIALMGLMDAEQIRDYVCDGCEDEVTCSNWVFLFSFAFLKEICTGLQSVSSVLSECRAASGLYVLSASIVVGTWAVLHFSAVTQSFGSLQFIHWEEKRLSLHGCVYFALELTQESLQPPSACASALIHVSSQVSDASNLYSRWLHNYILEKIRLHLTVFWTCKCMLLFLSVSHIFLVKFWCLINIDII